MDSIVYKGIENLDSIRDSLESSLVKGQAAYSRKPSYDKYQVLFNTCATHLQKLTVGIHHLCQKTNEMLTTETANMKSMETSVEQLMIMTDFMKQGISRRLTGERAIVKSKPKVVMFDRFKKSPPVNHTIEFMYNLGIYDNVGFGSKSRLQPVPPPQILETNIKYVQILEPKLYTFTLGCISQSNLICFFWKMPFVIARVSSGKVSRDKTTTVAGTMTKKDKKKMKNHTLKESPSRDNVSDNVGSIVSEGVYMDLGASGLLPTASSNSLSASKVTSISKSRSGKILENMDKLSTVQHAESINSSSKASSYNRNKKPASKQFSSNTTDTLDVNTSISMDHDEIYEDLRGLNNVVSRSSQTGRSVKKAQRRAGGSRQPIKESSMITDSDISTDYSSDRINSSSLKKPLYRARVLYAYKKSLEDELTINPDDLIEVFVENDDGWVLASLRGQFGLIPGNFIKRL